MLTAVHERTDDPRPEFNTTPLIDVMLVLLTMLMITLPVMTHSIKLDVAGHTQALLAQSANAEFHLRPARLVRFEWVAKTLAEMEHHGARRIMLLGNECFL